MRSLTVNIFLTNRNWPQGQILQGSIIFFDPPLKFQFFAHHRDWRGKALQRYPLIGLPEVCQSRLKTTIFHWCKQCLNPLQMMFWIEKWIKHTLKHRIRYLNQEKWPKPCRDTPKLLVWINHDWNTKLSCHWEAPDNRKASMILWCSPYICGRGDCIGCSANGFFNKNEW